LLAAGRALTLAAAGKAPHLPGCGPAGHPGPRNVEGAGERRRREFYRSGRVDVTAAVPMAAATELRLTMANPFEDPDASYRVLVNHEGQYSLWPANQPTPEGWTVVHDTDSRSNCLEYIEENWTDMRPKSLIETQGT
jgi:MbtH protein